MRKKFIVKNYRKKKIIFSIVFILLFSIGIGYSVISTNLSINGTIDISKYDNKTLYGVLRSEALNNGLAKEYTGEHHDSFTEEPSKKIYHWYAENDSEGTEIQNKNNVIFAGHCWQMIRTTDTGGVKMIYNGEAEDEKCLNTRGNHEGFSDYTTVNLDNDYYYGSDYLYDKNTKTFTLSGSMELNRWNNDTSTNLIGHYTCKSGTFDSTCSELYYVESYSDSTSANCLILSSDFDFSIFGNLSFNSGYFSLGDVGYMYNTRYTPSITSGSDWGELIQNTEPLLQTDYINVNNDEIYPFSWNEQDKKWISTMKTHDKSASIFFNISDVGNYQINYSVSSESGYDIAYFYKNGTQVRRDSGSKSGKILLNNLSEEDIIQVKYTKDESSSSGSDSVTFSMEKVVGNSVDNRYFFGNDVSYNNGIYTLQNTIRADIGDDLSNNHYSCLSTDITCSKVYYIYYIGSFGASYIELENGNKINNVVDDMLYSDNVNSKNSLIKSAVDSWYERNLTSYSDYIEDTIYCNDRSQSNSSLNGWNPNGGDLSIYMKFFGSSDLSCPNVTDRFSVSNEKAKLKYKIGLLTYREMQLLNNNNARKSNSDYWLLSPCYYYSDGNATVRFLADDGGTGGAFYANGALGIRPTISLRPGTHYSDGDGSMENPYVVLASS